jgi:hypothetical protein
MSIQATINSPDLNAQIEILKLFPQITAKHYRPALNMSVAAVASVVRPLIPRGPSGLLEDTFGTKVSGRLITTLKGQIGWFDKGDAWYANILEEGAVPHEIKPRGNRISKRRSAAGKGATSVLAWMDGGGWNYAKSVNHPGTSRVGMLAAGYAASKPIVEAEMGAAGEKVVTELASIKSFGISY